MTRINLSDAIDDLAPAPPPCFLNRLEWIEYLKSAAASQNHGPCEPKIILVKDGQPRINWDYPICADCTQVHSLAMAKAGKCHPNALKKQAPKECAE